jgi:Zn-dependent protease with chaperone function
VFRSGSADIMTDKLPLDLERMQTSSHPLQAILFVFTAIGVALGLLVIIAAGMIGVMVVPGGFFAMLAGVLTVSTQAVRLVMLGALAVLLVPAAALLAAQLKLRQERKFIEDTHDVEMAPAGPSVREIVRLAGLTAVPHFGVMEGLDNAFARSGGRDVGLVVIGRPFLNAFTPSEIMAIFGHEVGHIAMEDSKRKLLAIGHQDFLVTFLVSSGLKRLGRAVFCFAGELLLAAHSREREFWADAVGAHTTSKEAMIAALRRIDTLAAADSKLEKHYAALMFRPVKSWFSTHPKTSLRIEALEKETYISRLPLRTAPVAPAPSPVSTESPRVYDGI